MKRVVITIDGSCSASQGLAVGRAFCDAVNMSGNCKVARRIAQTTGWSLWARSKQEDGRQWRYEWTAEGRLKGVETPKGDRWEYQYDAFGRRVRKTGPKGLVDYAWDGAVVAEEIRGQKVTAWEYEPGTFRPLGKREKRTDFTACVTDQAGTPRELVNGRGEVVWRATFTSWGEVDEVGERKTECPIRF